MAEGFKEASANAITGHNHLTRDIKPRGVCPECDRIHAASSLGGIEGDGSDCTQCRDCGFCVDCGDCARLGCGDVRVVAVRGDVAHTCERGDDDRCIWCGRGVLVPVDTAERVGDGRTVLRPSDSPCRKHGIRGCPKC